MNNARAIALYRIAAETRSYSADDLSGAGAAKFPGRWNKEEEFVVYCAPTRALSFLETAAHVDDAGLPLNRFLVEIRVPQSIWRSREVATIDDLPEAWSAVPSGLASADFGSAWYQKRRSALLLVPSVLVPEEPVVLINAKHPGAKKISAKVVRPFEFNRLFRPK